MRNHVILALLIAGMLYVSPVWAVSPDPDNAAGIDLHTGTVKENLVVGISDTTSGNTVQVGPIGGIFEGAGSSTMGYESGTAYSGACALSSIMLTGNAISEVSEDDSAAAVSGPGVLTNASFSGTGTSSYVEFYDGTARGDRTTCLLDLSIGTASDSKQWAGSIPFNVGLYIYTSGGGTYQALYRTNDYIEVYDGTSRGNYSTCKLDLRVPSTQGTVMYNLKSIEFATGIYVYNSDAANMWGIQYRVEDQSE